jgi:hypothetical protein
MTETEPRAPIQSAPKRVDLPATAAWQHLDARAGFEVLFLRHKNDRYHLDGYVTAVEEGEPWASVTPSCSTRTGRRAPPTSSVDRHRRARNPARDPRRVDPDGATLAARRQPRRPRRLARGRPRLGNVATPLGELALERTTSWISSILDNTSRTENAPALRGREPNERP